MVHHVGRLQLGRTSPWIAHTHAYCEKWQTHITVNMWQTKPSTGAFLVPVTSSWREGFGLQDTACVGKISLWATLSFGSQWELLWEEDMLAWRSHGACWTSPNFTAACLIEMIEVENSSSDRCRLTAHRTLIDWLILVTEPEHLVRFVLLPTVVLTTCNISAMRAVT